MSDKVEKDGGGRAFPGIVIESPGNFAYAMGGMSLRDWFAGMAMQGILSGMPVCTWEPKEKSKEMTESIAKIACVQADALIEELKK